MAMVSMVTCELNHKLGLIYDVYIEIGLKHERPLIYIDWNLKKGLDLRKCDAVTDARCFVILAGTQKTTIYIEIQGHVVAVLMGFLELSGSSFTKTWTGNQPSGI